MTEFQVIEREGIGACIGIKIAGQQGLIHSEAIADFTQRGQLAPALWERIQVVARNHGLHWLWMDEPEPSWIQIRFWTRESRTTSEAACHLRHKQAMARSSVKS